MTNDIDLLYALVEGVAREKKVRYPPKAQFRNWVRRSSVYKRAEENEKFLLVRRRNPKGPWMIHNMQLLEVPEDHKSNEGISQAGREVVERASTPATQIAEAAAGGSQVEKHCTHCHESKPLKDFYRNPETRDGLASWCKSCTREKAGGKTWIAVDPATDDFLVYQVRDGFLTVKDDQGQRVKLKNRSSDDTLVIVNKIKESFFNASNN